MASYQLSGDPTVLLTLGERIIRELNEHLAMEEAFAAGRSIPKMRCSLSMIFSYSGHSFPERRNAIGP